MNNPNKDLVKHLRWLADKIESKKILVRMQRIEYTPKMTIAGEVVTWAVDLDLEVEIGRSDYEE